jgi:hypothetical protein
MMFDVKPRKSSGWETINKNSQVNFTWESLLVAGDGFEPTTFGL